MKPWTYNEFALCSVTDYLSVEEAARYDARMRTVRDVDAENRDLIARIQTHLEGGLTPDSRILEIGTGTGAFARAVAPLCKDVVATDVSPTMLDYAQRKAAEEHHANITFVHNGFLTCNAPDASFDVVLSSLVLHHLPDAWKAEAIANVYRMIRPGGLFLLVDVVFDCEGGQLDAYLAKSIAPDMNPDMKTALYGHVRQEYSTLRWIMDGILERAGFEIRYFGTFGLLGHLYVCRKMDSCKSGCHGEFSGMSA
ncbi:MAG: methyltransferase domain-containing protein [Planctomycetia bacterium]|nr:methyltransferase domain-containing protein [Planctomycetia bacterium]